MVEQTKAAKKTKSTDEIVEEGGITSVSEIGCSSTDVYVRDDYTVRYEALDLAIKTNSDNRSMQAKDIIQSAKEYEEFLMEVNKGLNVKY